MRIQATDTILMVRPANFGYNQETAQNNAFQSKQAAQKQASPNKKAREEFDRFASKLKDAGITVEVWEDRSNTIKPDAIFPNNWISFHQDDSIGLYPMNAKSRRKERDPKLIQWLKDKFSINKVVDFTSFENQDVFLEGTGSLILDRVHKIAYACISPRTDELLMNRFCKQFGYKKVLFHAVDDNKQAIYHTNVMMAMGDKFVVICKDSILDKNEWMKLKAQFKKTKKAVIDISWQQMNKFAGNMLLLRNSQGKNILVMSSRAYKSLTASQIKNFKKYADILHSDITTIENLGGGSVRCMMAEIFLQSKLH